VKAAQKREIPLRQTYVRVGKYALIKRFKCSNSRKMRLARKYERKLKTYLGRVIRDIKRKCPNPDVELKELLEISSRIHNQKRTDKNKVYSVHEPHVECISKGKPHKKYEFGCKASFVTTAQKNWIVSAKGFHGNPYDGHTLRAVVDDVTQNIGFKPKIFHGDQGYRLKVADRLPDVEVKLTDRRKRSRTEKKWNKRRASIEPVIGHLKAYHRMGHNLLKGKFGD